MGARLVMVFVINLEKDIFLCYKQKIATMFEVHHKVKFFLNTINAGQANTHIVFVSVQPTKLNLIIEPEISLKILQRITTVLKH